MMVGENKGFSVLDFLKKNKIKVKPSEHENEERKKIVLLNESGKNVLKIQKTPLWKPVKKKKNTGVKIINWWDW